MIKDIKLPMGKEEMCLQQFADDTNALVSNEDTSLKAF